jgi:hypothetical protein
MVNAIEDWPVNTRSWVFFCGEYETKSELPGTWYVTSMVMVPV